MPCNLQFTLKTTLPIQVLFPVKQAKLLRQFLVASITVLLMIKISFMPVYHFYLENTSVLLVFHLKQKIFTAKLI